MASQTQNVHQMIEGANQITSIFQQENFTHYKINIMGEEESKME